MNPLDDHLDDMDATRFLSDEAIEAFFAGQHDPDWASHEFLEVLDREVAVAAGGAPPPIGPALGRLLRPASEATTPLASVAQADPTASVSVPRGRPLVVDGRSRSSRRRAIALVGGALAAAASALPVAAATQILPTPAQQAVVRVLEAVTPFDFGDRPAGAPDRPEPAPIPPPPAATSTEGDGDGPVPAAAGRGSGNGASPAPEAPANRATPPPASHTTPAPAGPGLDVAGRTPAGGLIPPSAGPPADAGPPDGVTGGQPPAPGTDHTAATPPADNLPPAMPASPPRGAGR